MKPPGEEESETKPPHNSESNSCPDQPFTAINQLGGKSCRQRDKDEKQEFDKRHELRFYLSMHVEKPIQQKHAGRSDEDQ